MAVSSPKIRDSTPGVSATMSIAIPDRINIAVQEFKPLYTLVRKNHLTAAVVKKDGLIYADNVGLLFSNKSQKMVHIHAMGRDLVCSEDQMILAKDKKDDGPPKWITAKDLSKKCLVAIPRSSIPSPPEFPLLPSSLGIYSPLLGRMGRLMKRDSSVPASSIMGQYVPDDATPASPQLTGIIQRIPLCSSKEISINLTRFTKKCVTSSSDKLASDMARALLRSCLRSLCEASFYPFNDTPRSRAIIRIAGLIDGRAGINTYINVQQVENVVLRHKNRNSNEKDDDQDRNMDDGDDKIKRSHKNGKKGKDIEDLDGVDDEEQSVDSVSEENHDFLSHSKINEGDNGKNGKNGYFFKQLNIDNSPNGLDSKLFKIPPVFKDSNCFLRMWVLCDDISVLYHLRSDIAALGYGVPKIEPTEIYGNNGPFAIVYLPTDVALILIGLGFVTIPTLRKISTPMFARYDKDGEACYLPTGKISTPPFVLCRVSPAVASTFVRGLLGSRMNYGYSGNDAVFIPPIALGGSPRIRGAIGCLMARVGVAASFSRARIRSVVKYPQVDNNEAAKLSDKEIISSASRNSANTRANRKENNGYNERGNITENRNLATNGNGIGNNNLNNNNNNNNTNNNTNNNMNTEPLFMTLPTGLDTVIYVNEKDENTRITSTKMSTRSLSINIVTPPYFCAISSWYPDKIGFLNPAPETFIKYLRSNEILDTHKTENEEKDKKKSRSKNFSSSNPITTAELSLALPGMLGFPLRLLGSNQNNNELNEGEYAPTSQIPPPSYSIPNTLPSISVSTRRVYDTLRSGLKYDGGVESGFLSLLQSPTGFVAPCTSEGLVAAIPTLQYIYMRAALLTPLPYEINPKRNKLPQFSRNLVSGVKRVDLSIKCASSILRRKDSGLISPEIDPEGQDRGEKIFDDETRNLISCGAHQYVRMGIKERIEERKTFRSSCFIPTNGVTWDKSYVYLPVSSVVSVGKRCCCVVCTGSSSSQDSGVIINGFIIRGR